MEKIAKEQGIEELFTDESIAEDERHPPQRGRRIRECKYLFSESPSNPLPE
jgi:hypothetical protein